MASLPTSGASPAIKTSTGMPRTPSVSTASTRRKSPGQSFLQQQTAGESGVFVAASDYLKALPETIARQLPGPGNGTGHRRLRPQRNPRGLRDFFEVDARHIAFAALSALARDDTIPMAPVKKARKRLKIDPDRSNPLFA
jgi:pyruvate dehydrogenase E1 component